MGTQLDVSVIVPTRDAAGLLPDCLESIRRSNVRELIVVDGRSTDDSRGIAERYGATVLSDDGGGLPVARYVGASHAASSHVALVDADVVLPDGSLEALLAEFESGGYSALQADQLSVSGPGYWGRALAYHHRTGRSRRWFGLVATIFDKDTLLRSGFDRRFLSGEDIEMRWRLTMAGVKIGVSERTTVIHRFAGDSFRYAVDQFTADGKGLGRMVRLHHWRGARLVLLPAAAAARGIGLCLLRRQPQWIPYFATYAAMNYVGMISVLHEGSGT